jgi:hypothetical protein
MAIVVNIPALTGTPGTGRALVRLVDVHSAPIVGLVDDVTDAFYAFSYRKDDLSVPWTVTLRPQAEILQSMGVDSWYEIQVRTPDGVGRWRFTVPDEAGPLALFDLLPVGDVAPDGGLAGRVVSADADNAIEIGTDGKLYVSAAESVTAHEATYDHTLIATALQPADLASGAITPRTGAMDFNEFRVEPGVEDMRVFGFIPGTPETTIEFDPDTYTFTIAPVATNWSYYRDSVKATITGSKQVVLSGSPPAAGRWFIAVADDAGTLSASQTAWTLGATDTSVPVAVVEWNSALTPKYLLYDERHPSDISRGMHAYAHLTRGAQYASGGAASGYTLQTATDAAITLAIAAGVFYDETLRLDVSAISDPDGSTLTYLCRHRGGTGGWNWSLSEVPF